MLKRVKNEPFKNAKAGRRGRRPLHILQKCFVKFAENKNPLKRGVHIKNYLRS